jgi:di/tricarboxylate transporter
MIIGLLILTATLLRTGVVDLAGRNILRHTGTNPTRLLAVTMIGYSFLSAFMSNSAATAFFVPIVFGLAKRAKISPSQLLLPLAFSSILTSSVCLISTSTNLVVSGLMTRYIGTDWHVQNGAGGVDCDSWPICMLILGRKLIPDEATGRS